MIYKGNHIAYIIDTNVNFREEPHLNGRIMGKLQVHDEIYLLGEGPFQEIENMNFCWYKIRLNGRIGYVYGAYIADQRFINTINRNNIILYTRSSRYDTQDRAWLVSNEDILLYINNRKINTGIFFSQIKGDWLPYCFVRTTNEHMYILFAFFDFENHDEDYDGRTICYEFSVNISGEIRYIGVKNLSYDELIALGYYGG